MARAVSAVKKVVRAVKGLDSVIKELSRLKNSNNPKAYSKEDAAKLNEIVQIVNAIEKNGPCAKPTLSEAERLTDEILDVILALAQLNFTKKVNVGYEDSNFNAVATGLNMLGQELQRSVVSKEALEKEIVFRRRAEKKLQQAHDFLETKVEKRTKELSKSNSKLKIEVEERIRAEEELRARELKYRRIFDTSSVSIWEEDASHVLAAIDTLRSQGISDLQRHFEEKPKVLEDLVKKIIVRDVNDATLKMFEAKSKDELLANLGKTFTPESLEAFKEIVMGLACGQAVFDKETLMRTLKGNQINVLMQMRVNLQKDNNSGILLNIINISEIRHLEQQLRQSQKMEAVGRLAGGVAHDFNNLLTVILSYGQMLKTDLSLDDSSTKKVTAILECAQRAATLTKQLLAFSRRQISKPVVADINEVLQKMEELLKRLLGEDISIVNIYDRNLGKVKVDVGQFEQVVMNLCVNARDAMLKNGKLTIMTENCEVRNAQYPNVSPGSYVKISVKDNGSGMPDEVKARVFEPFFTTKDVGKGSGLGLSTVYGIIAQSDGYIFVESKLGKGTTFEILLPHVAPNHTSATNSDLANRKSSSLAQTVLVVEDEESVRKVACMALRQGGYHVIEADGPREALVIGKSYNRQIDLMLSDVVMPVMSGPELAVKMTDLRPKMHIVYMSGYTDNKIFKEGISRDEVYFIPKPFMPDILLEKIRRVLKSGF